MTGRTGREGGGRARGGPGPGRRRSPGRSVGGPETGDAGDGAGGGDGAGDPGDGTGGTVPVGADGAGGDRRLVRRRRLRRAPDAEAVYRLVTDVPDHWYPFTLAEDAASAAGTSDRRLARGILLDASTLGVPVEYLPTPQGEVLTPDLGGANLTVFEEELPREGREVTRHRQLAPWTDGHTYLWSGRQVTPGAEEPAADLRLDALDEPDGTGSG